MASPEECREYAKRCLEMASRYADEEVQSWLFDMAAEWTKAAHALTNGAIQMSPLEAETEAAFCRRQANRLHALADECDDPDVRDQVAKMAKEWAVMAAAKEAQFPLPLAPR